MSLSKSMKMLREIAKRKREDDDLPEGQPAKLSRLSAVPAIEAERLEPPADQSGSGKKDMAAEKSKETASQPCPRRIQEQHEDDDVHPLLSMSDAELKTKYARASHDLIKRDYYEAAVALWTSQQDVVIPEVEELSPVNTYNRAGQLLYLQSPREWADNNHPLWKYDRQVWLDVLTGSSSPAFLPLLAHERWGTNKEIDLTRNLSSLLFSARRAGAARGGASLDRLGGTMLGMGLVESIIEEKCHALSGPLTNRTERAARLIHGAREAVNLNSFYTSGMAMSELFLKEMLSIDDTLEQQRVVYGRREARS